MQLLVRGWRDWMREQGVLIGLIGFMTLVYAAQWWHPGLWSFSFMAVPAEVVESWHHLVSGDAGVRDLRVFGTTLSCAFLHGSFEHLAGNMLFFWIFGALISELLGWRWLLGIVCFTAIGASATHIGMNRGDWAPMLGASGVVSGFMGAYLGMAMRWHLPDPHVWPLARPVPPFNLAVLAVAFVLMDYRELLLGEVDRIAYGAHAGGFTCGLFLTCFLTPMPRRAQPRR